jgi:hypothetical protein
LERFTRELSVKDKRYQVFISSTYEDLRAEQSAVQDAVISTGDFPVQMESFPAADEDQFEFIKSLIDECDYYVLIIAGRYGTQAEDGLSYTHKEFRYAVSQGVPVLVMLRDDRENLPQKRSERDPDGQKKLDGFIAEAEAGRLRKTWVTMDGLKLAVREALDYAKATNPRTGWIRGNSLTNIEALEELNAVRKQNDEFRQMLGELSVDIKLPRLPNVDEEIEITLFPAKNKNRPDCYGTLAKIKASWISLFPIYYDELKWSSNDWNGEVYHHVDVTESCVGIGSAIAGHLASENTQGLFTFFASDLHRLSAYYIEAGLVREDGEDPFQPAANRLARRLRIEGIANGELSIIDGTVTVGRRGGIATVIDDDIPF